MKITQLPVIMACLALIGLSACTEAEVGSKRRPFTMYFVPSVDAQKIASTADEMTKFVEKKVSQALYQKDDGFYVKSAIPTSYIAVIEAFGTKKADFAAFNTFSYILAKDMKKYDVDAVLAVIRGKDEMTYKGQIIARKDSGIKSLKDLAGKKFAYTDPASTSGFILPAELLKKEGVTLGGSVFAQKHDNVVTMVYQKQVDAGATFYSTPEIIEENGKKIEKIRDARSRVITQFPDVADKVKIIGFTDEIPNEPWVMRSQLYADAAKNQTVRKAIVDALVEYSQTPAGKTALEQLYTVSGVKPVSDDLYTGIRHMVASSNLDLEKMLRDEAEKKKK